MNESTAARVDECAAPAGPRNFPEVATQFSLVHLCWYAGTAIILAALILFASELQHDKFDYSILLSVYSAAAIVCAILVSMRIKSRTVIAGLLISGSIITMSYAIFVYQEAAGLWQPGLYEPFPFGYTAQYASLTLVERLLHSPLLAASFAAIASLLGLVISRFLPLCVLVALSCWYVLFDLLTPVSDREVGLVFAAVGAATVGIAWFSDNAAQANYGYYLNKLGMWIIPFGLGLYLDGRGEWALFVFAVANVFIIFAALYLRRPAGLLGGAGGVLYYLTHLYQRYFHDDIAFPIILFVAGALIVYGGWWIFRSDINAERFLPAVLQRWRPKERRDPKLFGI